MRSALICVFFTLIVQRDGSCTTIAENEEEFKPTPIPLTTWPRDKQEPAETLQEIIKTDATPVPPHYWEDALRHSVYLTLVRDKIDQLIAKGDYISPDSKPDVMAKEIDDHDLWDKIKTARFERLKEVPIPPADVTILAKGRLLEDEQGYRFIEDDAHKNCSDSKCAKGVKALWSVKRMRQGETSPGKYHYELTFSVTSQTTRKLKKAYENPVRTFTIKETTPPVDRQQMRPPHGKIIYHQERPQRALWVHKNINPAPSYLKRPVQKPHHRDLDRIFSSIFSDEDNYEEPYRQKPKTFFSNFYPQHAKVAHLDDRETYYQKKVLPYPMKPHRYSTHPPTGTPPIYLQHPYWFVDSAGNHPHVQPYSDNRFLPSNIIKTTRPAVLPTPITNYPLLKESTIEVPVKTKLNATEYTTKEPDVVTTYKIYHHQKQQSPMKISYASDHIRPPVYNAPPGVFVTMDKKPFKPMPPLKHSLMNKLQKPLPDFRPSPQVLDTQFSEMDSSADTAFRPISMDFSEIDVKDHDISENNKKNVRKPVATKKPGKKHEHIKSTHLTTVTPEIITAVIHNIQGYNISEDINDMEWANVLGAFSKTTPMASQREQSTKENVDPITSTTPLSTTDDIIEMFGDLIEEEITSVRTTTTTTTTSTTPKPKKRTRPPPKFNKPEKIKKQKRVTTTTTTTTPKPKRTYPSKKPTYDLTPQASSAATSSTNSIRETKTHKPPASTTTRVEISTSPRPTTRVENNTSPRPTTTTRLTTTSTSSTSTSSPTVDTEQPVVTTQPKSKNRFRQSTLMQKGTSVNHDKWSTSTIDKNRTNTATSISYPLRRKASKFTGYIPSSTPRSPEVERNREDHRDRVYSFTEESISSTTQNTVEDDILVKKPLSTLPTDEQLEIKDDQLSEWSHDPESEQEEEKSVNESQNKAIPMDAQESKDDTEYIFSTAKEFGLQVEEPTTELTVVASPYSATKNKTKCKKKKHNNLTTTEGPFKSSSEPEATDKPETSSTIRTTASPVTPDIFNELFGGFTMDDAKEEPESATPAPEQKPSESEKHEHYAHLDDDLEDFLHSLDQKIHNHAQDDKLDEEYDDDLDDEDSPYNIDEESKHFKDDYYEDAQESRDDQPFSLLELMDME